MPKQLISDEERQIIDEYSPKLENTARLYIHKQEVVNNPLNWEAIFLFSKSMFHLQNLCRDKKQTIKFELYDWSSLANMQLIFDTCKK